MRQKRKVGTIAPKKFIARLRKEKVEFDNYMQQVSAMQGNRNTVLILIFQDAHEFLIFLINHINEIIVGEQAGGGNGPGNNSKNRSLGESDPDAAPTWINEIFQVVGLFDILNLRGALICNSRLAILRISNKGCCKNNFLLESLFRNILTLKF